MTEPTPDRSLVDITWSAGKALAIQVDRHPYRSLLMAAGVGYVLGGGLLTRLTMRVIRIGMRMGALPLLGPSLSVLGGSPPHAADNLVS